MYTRACCTVCVWRISGTQLINFPQTWDEQRRPSAWKGHLAHTVLFVFAQKIDKFWFAANSMQTICGRRSAGLQSHPHIRAFGSRTIWHTRLYEALGWSTSFNSCCIVARCWSTLKCFNVLRTLVVLMWPQTVLLLWSVCALLFSSSLSAPSFCLSVEHCQYTCCLQVWKVWKKSGILKVGQEVCKKSGNFTNISKKFGKKQKRNSKKFFL